MFITLTRKLGKLLRGGAAGRQIFLGGLIGAIIGMVPGVNLTLIAAIFLLLLLNANSGVAILGIVVGKLLCIAIAPVTFQIGYLLIHGMGLEGLFRHLCDTPVLALLDLHVYCLVGGLPIAVVVGLLFGLAMVKLIHGLRAKLMGATDKSEMLQKLSRNKLVKIVLWLVFGKQKEALADAVDKQAPLLRKSGVGLAIGMVVVVLALEFLLLNMAVRLGVQAGVRSATGAEVNLDKAKMSLLAGKLELHGLQVTDPDKPTHNLVQLDTLVADLSVSDLLAKRYVVDQITASHVQIGSPRAKPGKLYPKAKARAEAAKKKGEEPKDALTGYFEKADEWKGRLDQIKEYMDKRKAKQEAAQAKEGAAQAQKGDAKQLAATNGYFSVSARDLIAKRPTWVVRKVNVDKVTVAPGAAPQNLEGADLSSHPELHPKPMLFTLSPSAGGPPTAALEFHFEQPTPTHLVKATVSDIALGEGMLSSNVPLSVQEGTVDLKADGQFSADNLNVPFTLVAKKLKANTQGGQSVLGLDPKTAQAIFKSLDELKIEGTLLGSLGSPRVKLDHKQIMASLKEALVKAGKAELARRAGEQVDRLKGEVAGKLQDALGDKVPGGVKEALKEKLPGGIGKIRLPGFGKPKEDKKEGKKEDEPKKRGKPADLIKKLF